LEKLGKGAAALGKAYGHAIERIDGQLAEDRSLARRTISWISHAQRPLTAQELCHALAIVPGDRCLNRDNFYDVEDIIFVCAGLVIVDKESNIIRLVHYTTQEYFEQIRLDWNPGAVEEIASACLTYLAFDTFRSGSCHNDEDFEKRLGQNVFLDYAARHWAEHIRPIEAKVSELALAFLQDNALVSCCTQVVSVTDYKYRGYSQRFPRSTTGLHLSARFGLVFLSRMLLTGDCKEYSLNVDAKDHYGQTPLLWAAENGHTATVQLLLEKGAEIESKDELGQTPLSQAAENGHTATIQLLLKKGAEIESKNDNGLTPLLWATRNGHTATVQLLLKKGAKIYNEYSLTPLLWAAENGDTAIVKLLLEKVAEIKSKDQDGQMLLSRATRNGHTATVQLLLERGAEILSGAARNGHTAIVKLLLEKGAEIESKDDEYSSTPLLWAAENGHTATVQLLLEKGADIESKDQDGQTPLLRAAENGHTAIVQLLLEKGAEIESKDDKYGKTPLLWATWYGHKDIVEVLLGSPKRSN
jgi:ankyrin repeat protein